MLAGKLYQVIFLDLISCACVRVPTDCSPPGSSVHGFSRQEYWRGLPFPLLYLLHWEAGSLPLVPPRTPNKAWERNATVGCRMQMRTQSPELVCNLGGTEPQQQPGSRAQADGLGLGGWGGWVLVPCVARRHSPNSPSLETRRICKPCLPQLSPL